MSGDRAQSETVATRFVGFLTGLEDRDDRAALAALRRGLGKPPGEAAEMFPYVVPWIGNAGGWREEVFYLVASLFALHPANWRTESRRSSNLGASLRWAAGSGGEPGIESRFVAMLNSDREDLPDHLRHAVSLCRSKDVPINWLTLLEQLPYWESRSRWVQRDWARGFWGQAEAADTTEEIERQD